MITRHRRQVLLLDRYRAALRGDLAAPPPTGLDPTLAEVTARVVHDGAQLEPSAAFLASLRGQLQARAHDRPSASESPWSIPALDTRRRQTVEREQDTIMSTSQTTTPDPTPITPRHWAHEALKIAAAAIVFTIVGVALALALRDDDGSNVAAPNDATVTPTPIITPADTTATSAAIAPATTTQPTTTAASGLPEIGTLSATLTVSRSQFHSITTGAGSVWLVNSTSGEVERIDPATNQVVATITAGLPTDADGLPNLVDVAYGAGSIWVTSRAEQTVVRINPATNEIIARVPVDVHPGQLSASDDAVWVGSMSASITDTEAVLTRIDPASNAVIATIDLPDAAFNLQAHAGRLWAVTMDGQLLQVDSATNQIHLQADIEPNRAALAVTDAGVWVTQSGYGIGRFDLETGEEAARIQVSDGRPILAVADGEKESVWVVVWERTDLAHLERINPATNAIDARTPSFAMDEPTFTGADPYYYVIATAERGSLWVMTTSRDLVRIEVAD